MHASWGRADKEDMMPTHHIKTPQLLCTMTHVAQHLQRFYTSRYAMLATLFDSNETWGNLNFSLGAGQSHPGSCLLVQCLHLRTKRTVYLTVEETARIRKTFDHNLQQCQELAGRPRVPRDVASLLRQATTAALLADLAASPDLSLAGEKSNSDTIVTYSVGNSYPPCTLCLEDLKPMLLCDLRMDTHHRGCVLTLRRNAPVVSLVASSWTVVEEMSFGEMARLEVILHKSRYGGEILEFEGMIKIKEPYFTLNDQGEATLRIDHPSDLVFCFDSSMESKNASIGLAASRSAKECKEEGNAALKRCDVSKAHTGYTEGLSIVANGIAVELDLVCDLFRNRAQANLLLGRFDEAQSDALAAVTRIDDEKHKALDSKALFRAACAAYSLRYYETAKSFFEDQQSLAPKDESAFSGVRKCEKRLREMNAGVYNFKKIKAGFSTSRLRVDAAAFEGNTRVGDSPGRGRGLFATRNMAPGELVLCEKAFCVVWTHEADSWTALTYDVRDGIVRLIPAGLREAVMQKLVNNPSQVEKVMDLQGDYRGLGKRLVLRDGQPVVDSFQIHDIVAHNAFGLGSTWSGQQHDKEGIHRANTGLWIRASYMNHSCLPNTEKENIGDLMVFRAVRPILAGEEVTHSYIEACGCHSRSAALKTTWGFKCTCVLCLAKEPDSTALETFSRIFRVL